MATPTFADLEFGPHPRWPGVQALSAFPNGYTASVIRSTYSYGGADGLYEVAILHGDDLVYDTPVTDDVLGSLTEAEVADTLAAIAALPERVSA